MVDFLVKVGREKVKIDKEVFLHLLDLSHVREYTSYEEAVQINEITLSELKNLAEKANVPYPLFFCPIDKVKIQIQYNDTELLRKLPSKSEIRLNSRGKMKFSDIELVAKDLARKQTFLKQRILLSALQNEFIGSIAKKISRGVKNENIAEFVREYFTFDLKYIRKISKDNVLKYFIKILKILKFKIFKFFWYA